MDNIHAATKKELPATIQLTNAVFNSEWANITRLEEKFPIFLEEKNLDHIQIITDGGKPVSQVGVYQSKVIIEGAAAIHVGSIGPVCTDPANRGKRLASQILFCSSSLTKKCTPAPLLMNHFEVRPQGQEGWMWWKPKPIRKASTLFFRCPCPGPAISILYKNRFI